jgi:threonine/homoserine/homoserine lactone efflux protein
MPAQQAWAFLLFALAAAATPGPSNVLVMAAGARAGLLGGLRCLAGVVAGMGLLMGTAVLGLGALLQAWPDAMLLLKAAGSLLLLRLAWQVARASPPGEAADGAQAAGFGQALLFQWVNPKSWVVGASAAATFGGAAEQPVLRALTMGMLFAAAAAVGCSLWLAGGALLRRWLGEPRRARSFNRTMGLLLAASVLLLWT